MTFISQTVRPSSTPDIVVPDIDCDSSVLIGHWVRIDSSNHAVSAIADSIQNSEVFGVVEDKPTSVKCVVRVAGVSKNIFSSLDVTKSYFLSAMNVGEMSLIVPTNSGEVVLSLGRSLDGEKFLVQPTLRMQRS